MAAVRRLLLVAGLLAAGLATVAAPPAGAELTTAVYRTDGVDGAWNGPTTNVIPAHVWDLQTIGNTVYAAGQFTEVVSTQGSWPRIDQPFLAAFDATSGRFLDWWRPEVDAPVWALDVTPGGQLLVAGEFDNVNGVPRSGLVALDARTGAIAPGFYAEVLRPNTTAQPVIRDLHRDGDRLYLVGNFSRVQSGDPANPTRVQVTKAARVDASTGAVDPTWAPVIAGRSAWAVATSGSGTRVHLGGEFSYVNGANGTSLMATVDAVTGANLAGWENGSHAAPRSNWPLGGIVYDLGVHGDNLFVSGAEHYWEHRNAVTGRAIRVNSSPHDTQRIEVIGDRVYIGCHCIRTSRALQLIEVSGVTGTKLRDLGNSLTGGDGAWAFAKAPDACLWTGGDFRSTSQLVGGNGTQWVGRVARLCDTAGPLPHSVPSLTPPPPAPDPDVLVPRGAPWRYWADGTHPEGWTEAGFDDRAWPSGDARLGFGAGDEVTAIDPVGDDGRRILSAVFRHTFDVADPGEAPRVELELNVDDGATVWLNGRPVVAQNVPSGEITAGTYATDGIFGDARRAYRSYLLPSSALVAGVNTLAVSVHQNYRNSPQFTLDASLRFSDDGGATTPAPAITVPDADPAPPAQPTEFVAPGATWRHLDDGSDQGTAWRTAGFDDGTWAAGPAPLGAEIGDVVTVTRTGGRPVTAYFRHRFTVADARGFTELTVRLRRDDGVVVHLNGTELVRDNLPGGTITSATNAAAFVTGAAQSRFYEFTVPASALRTGENVLAVEVHQAPESKDLAFDLALSGR